VAEEQMVIFRIAGEEYAVSVAETKEILQYLEPTRLPNSLDYVEGLINVRGHIIPVVNLSVKFGLVDNQPLDRRVIITEIGNQKIGVIVDEVLEVVNLADADLERTPEIFREAGSCIKGVGKVDSRLIILLDMGQLFTGEEMTRFASRT
jgi:purine-binding chemotaxis protein CheW